MKNQRRLTKDILLTALALALTGLIGPLTASGAPQLNRAALSACDDYELNQTQERVYFKDTIEYITPMADGTFVLEYTQQAAYYAIDPGQTPNASGLLSRAQSALTQATQVYTTASTSAADLHVIQYLSDKKDPNCIPG